MPLVKEFLNKELSQFHYGSIKTLKGTKNEHNVKKSQFHYGSIKTLYRVWVNGKDISESQFHYGSIKTNYLAIIILHYFNLNSTMVRLKLKQILIKDLEYLEVSIPLWFD